MYEFTAVVRTFYKIMSDEWTDGPLQLANRAVAGGGGPDEHIHHHLSSSSSEVKSLPQSTAPSMTACQFSPEGKGADCLPQFPLASLRLLEKLELLPPRRQTNALATINSHRQRHNTQCQRTSVCARNKHRVPGTGKVTLSVAPGIFRGSVRSRVPNAIR